MILGWVLTVPTQWLVAQTNPNPVPAPVSLELEAPPAVTRVIGDSTPLNWRFTNHTDQTIAFLWEGCCRKNGRLTITSRNGQAEPIPPGQALAHMFARAATISPGETEAFDTQLGDWADFQASGLYQLTGRYIGVLEEQKPQVPRGTQLWRGAAESPTIDVALVSVADYLGQRSDRSTKHRVRLELSGPASIPVQGKGAFSITITSEESGGGNLPWPDSARLWVIDAAGRRRPHLPQWLQGPAESLLLAPDRSVTRTFALSASDFEGEPLGAYKIFVELIRVPGSAETHRVPSNAIRVDWTLNKQKVLKLLAEAAAGKRAGARNPALKLLRVYLNEIGSILDSIEVDELGTAAEVALTQKLRLASRLKAFAPNPGEVSLPLTIENDSTVRLADPLANAWNHGLTPPEDWSDQVRQILDVRRHLGWEIELVGNPTPDTSLDQIHAVAAQLGPVIDSPGVPLRFPLDIPNVPGTSNVHVSSVPPAAFLFCEMERIGGVIHCRVATANGPGSETASTVGPGRLRLETVKASQFSKWLSLDAASKWLAETESAAGHLVLAANGECLWSDLKTVLDPIRNRGWRIDLIVR